FGDGKGATARQGNGEHRGREFATRREVARRPDAQGRSRSLCGERSRRWRGRADPGRRHDPQVLLLLIGAARALAQPRGEDEEEGGRPAARGAGRSTPEARALLIFARGTERR